jgi:Uma2 family endonuclease
MDPAAKRIDWAAYLALESETGLKHEYQDGIAVAMAGGSIAHARLQGTVRDALKTLSDPRGCEVFPSDLRLWIPRIGRSTYADASVFCDPDADDERQALLNPVLLVEVLSPSTADYDRGDKFAAYRTLPSLQHVLFVDSTQVAVTHAWRADDHWRLRDHGPGDSLHLGEFGTLDVDALYVGWES